MFFFWNLPNDSGIGRILVWSHISVGVSPCRLCPPQKIFDYLILKWSILMHIWGVLMFVLKLCTATLNIRIWIHVQDKCTDIYVIWLTTDMRAKSLTSLTRKPCCRKETSRYAESIRLGFANNIHYKLSCSQAPIKQGFRAPNQSYFRNENENEN